MAWNRESADDWAKLLGFVPVDLFGNDRSAPISGTHVVLLDGAVSSLAFSKGKARPLLDTRIAAQWSWSSNVNHAVIIDDDSSEAFTLRWDQPDEFRPCDVSTPDSVLKLIESFGTDVPRAELSSVHLAMDVFRSLRANLSDVGGTNLDAIAAFTVLLLWSDNIQRGIIPATGLPTISLQAAASQLSGIGESVLQLDSLPPAIAAFPLGDVAQQILEERRGYRLDPYLLLRHASGLLFQEAHVELERPPSRQRKFLVSITDDISPAAGRSQRDARYTPTNLARLLSETAIRRFIELNPMVKELRVLDPACGSGVFLIETAHEASKHFSSVFLRGIDDSQSAVAIATMAIDRAAKSVMTDTYRPTHNIEKANSLEMQSWGDPHIILMNPPFLSWRILEEPTRKLVRDTLGQMYSGQSDTALAFIARAIESLRPGSVLATLAPSSFLGSRAAAKMRSHIYSDLSLSVEMVGLFRGYRYFVDAQVEPAFLLISKAPRQDTVSMILADSGAEDLAIRNARVFRESGNATGNGFEITKRASNVLVGDWTPRPMRGMAKIDEWLNCQMPRVTDLFDISLGIRTGQNPTLMISEREYQSIASEYERSFFMPVADTIRNGQIVSSSYVFYPYRNGQLTIEIDGELPKCVPWFYENKLLPNRESLTNRKSLRERRWWELSEPRPTWMQRGDARIVTPAFGYYGSFAMDAEAGFAIVQGSAWHWKGGHDRSIMLAYLALLNSYEFESLLELLCPKVAGGQYELYQADLKKVPLPDLSKCPPKLRGKLISDGERIFSGDGLDPKAVKELVAEAYGVSCEQFRSYFAAGEIGELQEVFDALADAWERKCRHFGRMRAMIEHPMYRQIVLLGRNVVPLLLRRLKNNPSFWFEALKELTGENPIRKEQQGRFDREVEAWLSWGRENRQL